MKKLFVVLLLVFCTSNLLAQIDFAFGGTAYLAPQYWSKVGTKSDPKFGIGLGGLVGIGISIDETEKFVIGPHFAVSRWNADYSDKLNSATSSVYVEMMEMGAGMFIVFDDMYMTAAMGKATIGSGMMVNGEDIKYPYDRSKYNYYHVGFGYKTGLLMFGIGYISYTGYAHYCDHMDFRLGIGL